jgi:hypothetical protein
VSFLGRRCTDNVRSKGRKLLGEYGAEPALGRRQEHAFYWLCLPTAAAADAKRCSEPEQGACTLVGRNAYRPTHVFAEVLGNRKSSPVPPHLVGISSTVGTLTSAKQALIDISYAAS